jgi:hypothetical protein
MLDKRDYTLIIDNSSKMSTQERVGGKNRSLCLQESIFALASKCEELDPDGITVYMFSGQFKRYDRVTANQVQQIFQENQPSGRIDLVAPLEDAIARYFQNKASGQTKSNGETIIVIINEEPRDRKAILRLLFEASQRMERDEELAISFIQVGDDLNTMQFLKALDDDMQNAGAKYDLVDTLTVDDMKNLTMTEVLLNAIVD